MSDGGAAGTNPENANPPASTEDIVEKYEEEKKQRLEKIKEENEVKEKKIAKLREKLRKQQIEKTKKKLEGNPLMQDQIAIYEQNLKRVSSRKKEEPKEEPPKKVERKKYEIPPECQFHSKKKTPKKAPKKTKPEETKDDSTVTKEKPVESQDTNKKEAVEELKHEAETQENKEGDQSQGVLGNAASSIANALGGDEEPAEEQGKK